MQQYAQNFHVDYGTRVQQWQKIRDALEGEDAIKAGAGRYLPKPTAQTITQYSAYKDRATFYAVTERTLRSLLGMVFRVDPIVEAPETLKERLENATPEGHSFDVWSAEAVAEVLTIGRYGILVDLPQGEVPAGTPPYFSAYKAEDIRNWQIKMIDGQKVLTRVCLSDDIDDEVGLEGKERVLELFLDENGYYTVNVWEYTDIRKEKVPGRLGGSDWNLVDTRLPMINGKPLTYIPFIFVSPYNLEPQVSKSPMLDLVNMNIKHYQNSADYEHALYLTAQPTPWVSGKLDEAKKPTAIGSGTIWYLPEGGQAGYLEFTGSGVSAQQKAMEDKEGMMAVLGARLIRDNQATSNIAADTVRLKAQADTSVLTSTVRMVEQAFEKAFKIALEWMSVSGEVKVSLNKDFVETRLDHNELNGLIKAWQVGAISRTTLHQNLQKGEIVAPDRTMEDEVDEIESDGVGLGLIQPAEESTGGSANSKPGRASESEGGASATARGGAGKPAAKPQPKA